MVHLLVADSFLGPAEGREVNHKDGHKPNCMVDNLEYVSRIGNAMHAKQAGLYQRGSDRHNALLTEQQVKQIRFRYRSGLVMQKTLAEDYGVTKGTIQSIVTGKTWNWVKND